MPDPKKKQQLNTDKINPNFLGGRYPVKNNPDVLEAHQRLFGLGARVDPTGAKYNILQATPDELAYAYAPKAEGYQTDINLPDEHAGALGVLKKKKF